MKRKTILVGCLIFLLGYLGAYLGLRFANVEKWEKDGNDYLIFPKESPVVYYLFRPLTYIDGYLTGLRFHIGPHPANP